MLVTKNLEVRSVEDYKGITLARQHQERKVEKMQTKVLEEPKNPKSVPFYNALVQAQHELTLAELVPEMKHQRGVLKHQISLQSRMFKIIEMGFDPFRPTSNWFTGWLEKPNVKDLSRYNIYKHAFPAHATTKYIEAKNTNLFDFFSIHSPSTEVFESVRMTNIDPVLVGWVDAHIDSWGQVYGGQGFLIAAWDLQKDLAASGLLLAPTH